MANRLPADTATIGQVITPAGVRRRVVRLWHAWQSLVSASHATGPEAGEFMAWAKPVLDSLIDQVFATGTLDELDRWQDRYRIAYEQAGSPKAARNPATIDKTDSINPWLILGFLVIGYLIFREFKR